MFMCVQCGVQTKGFICQVGIVCADCTDALTKICDFCSEPPSWRYPVRAFVCEELESASAPDWMACQTCHDLIEARKFVELCRRATDIHAARYRLNASDRQFFYHHASILHNLFRTNRTGDPVRIDH